MGKVVLARVDGDPIGFEPSPALACALVVSTEDARFIDHHLAMREIEGVGPEYGVVTGDGGSSLVPLYTSPRRRRSTSFRYRSTTESSMDVRASTDETPWCRGRYSPLSPTSWLSTSESSDHVSILFWMTSAVSWEVP